MLHAWLDWTEVDRCRDVVEDFRKIGQIRSDNADIFHNNMFETNLINVPYTASPPSPVVPYARYVSGKKACVVVGNNNSTADIRFSLDIPVIAMGFDKASQLDVTDCWTGTTTRVAASALKNYAVVVPRDQAANGGLRVLTIAAMSAQV